MDSLDYYRQKSDAHPSEDADFREASPSGSWRFVCAALDVSTDVEPPADAIAAAVREDRPTRYREKHILEVTS